jgi:hypothetical protein
MSLNSNIINALTPVLPCAFHQYTGTATTYCTFFTYNQMAGLIADDDEQTTVFSIQVDVFSKGNLDPIVKQVKDKLKTFGFRRTSEIEMYNIDTKTYRKSISLTATFNAE